LVSGFASAVEKDTVSMHFVAAAVARLSTKARRHVLAAAGIPEELLAASHARVPAPSFAALWLAVAREIDDEFFGLDRRRMKVGSFALLSHAVLDSGNLDRAVKHMLRGFAVFLDDINGDLRLEDQQAVIAVANRIADVEARRFADETFLILVHGLMCWLAGQRIPLLSAEFTHPRPPHAAEYAVMYSQHLVFDAEATAIRFDARLLNAPVVQNARSLKVFLRTAPQSVFLKYKNEDSWTARLRRRMRDSIGHEEWPVLEEIAREFNVAPTTLRRRLDAEGTSYQIIKDELRRDAAIHHLCTTSLSVADIGSLLGFQEPSAFYRAFKKWSSVQPGEYRLRQARGLDVEGDKKTDPRSPPSRLRERAG
jgi:AraC-like DNA-binding protein